MIFLAKSIYYLFGSSLLGQTNGPPPSPSHTSFDSSPLKYVQSLKYHYKFHFLLDIPSTVEAFMQIES